MLKRFFLNLLSSFVGTWIAIMLFGVVIVLVCIGLAARFGGATSSGSLERHSILTLDLSGVIEEREEAVIPDYSMLLKGGIERPQTLDVITKALREAAVNKNIDALYIKCGRVSASPATLNAIREEVADFKKSGKKIYAYGGVIMSGAYYVASVADSIFINPYGSVEMTGLSSTSLYMKNLFDKIGISWQVVKVGTFKSAVEPYIMNEMSEPARAQLDTLFGNMWGYMRDKICENRKKLSPAKIDSLINVVSITFAPVEDAVNSGLVDKAVYERTMDSRFATLVGKKKKDLNFVSPSDLVASSAFEGGLGGKNQIAVVYATGEIVDGASSGINYEKLVPTITELAENDDVKGLVLRVNSPGGSAYGSDQIGEALDYFKSKGKPLAVSMGDYAASGGYWISCGADVIYADPLTITGSIGIFGLIPNGEVLLEKIGVNPQFAGTNPQADFPTLYKPMDERQLAVVQKNVERGYDRFINRVAKGRKMPVQKVREIAEGRVWDAIKAKKIGLVDNLGNLEDAIEWTAKKASVEGKYNLTVYPVIKPSFWDMVADGSTFEKIASEFSTTGFSEFAVEYVRSYLNRERIQARMLDFKAGF
ncbi:MAG: signal peptide peptidase SppA [Muribaculaceae bacterium]|nr:signal peptide peptidase SppA [Muribaculaceae bacterium]